MSTPLFHSLPMTDADVLYFPGLIGEDDRARLFKDLRDEAAWKQDRLRIQGHEVDLPRLTAWHGDPGTAYGYSGIENQASPWTPRMQELLCLLSRHVDASFNSVLLNLYRNGKDSVSWHADDERELGVNPIIASVSLGASRKFSFKHRTDKNKRCDLVLGDGDLLVMRGQTQVHWLHQVPKTSRPVGERMNLTFRMVRRPRPGFVPGWA